MDRVIPLKDIILELNGRLSNCVALEISLAIQLYAMEYELDPLLVLSVIRVETGNTFDRTANRGTGWGLMQIVPRWHLKRMKKYKISKSDLYRVFYNIRVGCDILAECLDVCKGNIRCALLKYNGSEYKEAYTSKVIRYYKSMSLEPGERNLLLPAVFLCVKNNLLRIIKRSN